MTEYESTKAPVDYLLANKAQIITIEILPNYVTEKTPNKQTQTKQQAPEWI